MEAESYTFLTAFLHMVLKKHMYVKETHTNVHTQRKKSVIRS